MVFNADAIVMHKDFSLVKSLVLGTLKSTTTKTLTGPLALKPLSSSVIFTPSISARP